MPTDKRRADARRRAWGRGPIILRFEPLEGRELLSTASALPDLAGQSFQVPSSLAWGQSFTASGVVVNDGNAAVTTPIQVVLYASPAMGIASGAQAIGSATIPAGLQPGASASFTQQVALPATPLSGIGSPPSVYLGMSIDPNQQIAESNKQNNYGVGLGFDTALATITASPGAALVGTGLQLSASQVQWGNVFSLTEQIANKGNVDVPATTALVVLTPPGATLGGATDATVGKIDVPALAAGQSTTVHQDITLPVIAPVGYAKSATYILSVAQDADFVTNPIAPHVANQGQGLDQASLAIATPIIGPAAPSKLPTLAVSGVGTPSTNIQWGQNFQVSATFANTGSVDSGPVRVRFLLVGTGGTLNGLFLGDTGLSNIPANSSTPFTMNLHLPASPPAGISSQADAGIAVVLDPEHSIPQASTAKNVGFSGVLSIGVVATPGPATTTTTTVAAANPTTPTAAKKHVAAHKPAQHKSIKNKISHDLKVAAKKVSSAYHKFVKKL